MQDQESLCYLQFSSSQDLHILSSTDELFDETPWHLSTAILTISSDTSILERHFTLFAQITSLRLFYLKSKQHDPRRLRDYTEGKKTLLKLDNQRKRKERGCCLAWPKSFGGKTLALNHVLLVTWVTVLTLSSFRFCFCCSSSFPSSIPFSDSSHLTSCMSLFILFESFFAGCQC